MKSVALNVAAEREVRRLLQAAQARASSGEGSPSPPRVRLAVRKGGCNGYYYDLGAAAEISPEDRLFESCGVTIAIDPASFTSLADVDLAIDYTEDLVGGAFRFEALGGSELQHCDCGLSFRRID